MPTLVWLSLPAWLYDRPSATCVAFAEAWHTVSHDRLTRLLQADWSGHTRLELAGRTLFVVARGYLIIDDTGMPKPFATAIAGLAWVYASQAPRAVDGLSRVWLLWTEGTVRLPLGMRLWHKGGASKSALALALLSDARHRLRCRPESVLFDAWYPSKALLKRVRDYGWDFICRLTKNRRFNHRPLRTSRRHPYWAETGRLSGGLKGLVVRDGATYFATHRLTLPAAAVRRLYRVRAHIEAIFRACKRVSKKVPDGPSDGPSDGSSPRGSWLRSSWSNTRNPLISGGSGQTSRRSARQSSASGGGRSLWHPQAA
jgi:DDE superfamily endonuclease